MKSSIAAATTAFTLQLFPTLAVADCGPNDVRVEKLSSRGKYGHISVFGVLTHKCSKPVGIQLKLVIFSKTGDIVDVSDQWPASTDNIPPNKPYHFEVVGRDEGRGASFTVEPISIKQWRLLP